MLSLLHTTSEPLVPSVQKLGAMLSSTPKTMGEYHVFNAKRREIAEVYARLWREEGLDAILMPPAPYTAVLHDMWVTPSYTAIWNLLDYPAFVLPTGTVLPSDAVVPKMKEEFYGEEDEMVYKLCRLSLLSWVYFAEFFALSPLFLFR